MNCSICRRILVIIAIASGVGTTSHELWAQHRIALNDETLAEVVDAVPHDDYEAAFTESIAECSCDASFGDCDCHRAASLNWVNADYLMWWTKGNRLPALVTTSPTGTLQANAGILGLPTTQVLFGDAKIANQERSGLRINAGRWLDDCREVGIEATYFSVFNDSSTDDFFAQTTGGVNSGAPILARPFFDVNIGQENARLFSFPNLADGSIAISSSSELHSGELLLRHHLRSGTRGRLDFLGGYRYFRFREGLRIDENFTSTAPGGGIAVGTTFNVFDSFAAENDFHGGQLGIAANFSGDRWDLGIVGKVALGNIHRTVTIDGRTVTTTPPPVVTANSAAGGLLALTSNIGQTTANDLACLPEVGVNLAYDLNDSLTLRVGYTLLALNNVARTGDQIDRSVNPNLIPGGNGTGVARPSASGFGPTDFWAQGISFGIGGQF